MITPEVEERLRNAGWFPSRRVDDAQVIEWLEMGVRDFGCHIFPNAVMLLREYGGLTLGDLHFSPEESLMRNDKFEWLRWEWEINEILFPIAYTLDDIFTYAISATGKVFASGVIDISCGDSFEEFLGYHFSKKNIQWPESDSLGWTKEKNTELYLVRDILSRSA